MMKKFMVLALVMGLASLASAAGSVQIIDEDGGLLLPGDLLTLKIVEDTNEAKGFAAFSMTIPGMLVADSLNLPVPGGLLPTFAAAQDGNAAKITGGVIYFPGIPAADGVLLTVQVNAPMEDGVYAVDVAGGYAGGDAAGLSTSFTVVPEPITLGLLGLGGLFIRRRK